MVQSFDISASASFRIEDYLRELDMPGATYVCRSEEPGLVSHYLAIEGSSTTLFVIDVTPDTVSMGIDGMAAWEDYKRFPYMLDILCQLLTGEHYSIDGQSVYQSLDEDWIADSMGEEIACLKAWLTVNERYYISLPLHEGAYVTRQLLREHGVCLHSSTPRIYGYIHHLMAYYSLPADPEAESDGWSGEELEVPQHIPIGRVRSWMLDGSETWESYSQEDVDLLLQLAADYRAGRFDAKGVVLNDIGTIYQMGIGVPVDGEEAAWWFAEGYHQGDHWFSPTNLGDLYRKGCGNVPIDLPRALEAYLLSDDPYAWYRIGQAWEEGWVQQSSDTAMQWYRRAADAGHHLAVKRLNISR